MARQLQNKEIVLVFTDIVDSVIWTVKDPEVFIEAQDKHRDIVREGLAKWRGEEKKLTGDGFFLVFSDPLDAVHWAKETQALLLDFPWPSRLPIKIRIGLHTGSPRIKAQPTGYIEYDGEPMNLTQRVMSAAEGGQIFASEAFFQRTQSLLPGPFALDALGLRVLKGFGLKSVWRLRHPDLPDAAGPLPDPTIPLNNLPFRPSAHFYGRADTLKAVRERLLSLEGRPLAVVGMGGSGKTQIALEYAHQHLNQADYPGGVFWLDARSDERLVADYAGIARRFFGRSEKDGAEQTAEWMRDALNRMEQTALVVFDNVTEKTSMQWLPASGRLHLLLTKQRQILPDNFSTLKPPPLSEDAALQLLQIFRLAQNGSEMAAAREIVRIFGGLPLALALAAHHIHALNCSFEKYLARLRDSKGPEGGNDPEGGKGPGGGKGPKNGLYDTLQKGRAHFIAATGHDGSVYGTIALAVHGEKKRSIKDADADDLKILAGAACFAPGSIPTDLLFQTSGVRDYDTFESAIISLWDRSLLLRESDESAEDLQSAHELVREYARIELLPACRRPLLVRAVRALTERLRAANLAMEWTAVRSDIAHCYAVAATPEKTPLPGIESLLLEIGVYLAEHRDCKAALEYYERGVARIKPSSTRRESQRDADLLLRAKFLRLMGEALEQEGERNAALRRVREAWRTAQRILPKDALEMADFCNSLGYVLKKRGNLGRALPFYLRALKIHQAQSRLRHNDIATQQNNIGALLEDKGDLEASRHYFQQALESARRAGGGKNILMASCLNNAGRILSKMDCWQEALELHTQARAIYEAAQGARHINVGASLFYVAEAQRGMGRRKEALANYNRAKRIFGEKYDSDHPVIKRIDEGIASLKTGGK